MAGPEVAEFLGALEEMAPLSRAESWDNVGLLLEGRARRVRRALLTVDLTEAVMAEALEEKVQVVVSYHPPIFEPLKRLDRSTPRGRTLLEAARAGVAIYSPHTALDAAPGGVNDWLADAFPVAHREPIEARSELPAGQECKVVVFVPAEDRDRMREALAEVGAGIIGHYAECSFNIEGRGTFRGLAASRPAVGRRGRLEEVEEIRLEMVCARGDLAAVEAAIRAVHPYEEPAWEVYPLEPRRSPRVGQGRFLQLSEALSLEQVLRRVKRRLGVPKLRLAASARHEEGEAVSSVALCAGAGGSVLKGRRADLWLTGEMRHHDVLAAVESGTSVILADHTNTERGFLPELAGRLVDRFGAGLEVLVSRRDRDPLRVV